MRNKFKEMFELQNKLNNNTNGIDWVKGTTLQGRTINWYRCIYMEAAEAIDSFPAWKHWKDINAKPDFENLKIELVDIWHFIMSQAIADKGLEKATNESFELYIVLSNATYLNGMNLIDILEKIIAISASKQVPLELFYKVVFSMDDFSMDDVYSLYIGKNCLNQFRQDKGYKDGSYIKIWDGKEDNVYMQKIISENPNINYDELYASLSDIYLKLQKK